MLSRSRDHALGISCGSGSVQRLHLESQAEQLSLHPYRPDRSRTATHRVADPHARHARGGRTRRRRALELQAGRRQDRRSAISLAARAGGNSRAHLEPGRVSRQHQARDVPGSGLRLHPERRFDRPAARRHRGRLRLCGPFPDRGHLRRGKDQRPAGAVAHGARQWRPGRDHHLQAQHPSPTWERFVVTGKARAASGALSAPSNAPNTSISAAPSCRRRSARTVTNLPSGRSNRC